MKTNYELYKQLVIDRQIIKSAHCLAIMGKEIAIEWDTAVTKIESNPVKPEALLLKIDSNVLAAVNMYNTKHNLPNEYKTIKDLLYRVLIATSSRIFDLDNASKVKVSPWFSFKYSDTGDFYNYLLAIKASTNTEEV